MKTSGGLNATWKVHVCCTFSVAGQLLVWVNVRRRREMAILVMLTGAAPPLVRVALSVLLEPTGTLPMLRDAGVNPSARVSPVPLRTIV